MVALRTSEVEASQGLESECDVGDVTLWHGVLGGDSGGRVMQGLWGPRMLHVLVQQNQVQHLEQVICNMDGQN